jgi:hypothetical protein
MAPRPVANMDCMRSLAKAGGIGDRQTLNVSVPPALERFIQVNTVP